MFAVTMAIDTLLMLHDFEQFKGLRRITNFIVMLCAIGLLGHAILQVKSLLLIRNERRCVEAGDKLRNKFM